MSTKIDHYVLAGLRMAYDEGKQALCDYYGIYEGTDNWDEWDKTVRERLKWDQHPLEVVGDHMCEKYVFVGIVLVHVKDGASFAHHNISSTKQPKWLKQRLGDLGIPGEFGVWVFSHPH